MNLRTGLETENDGRAIAWALEYPGCYAYGPDGAEALASLPEAYAAYAAWVKTHGSPDLAPDQPVEVAVEEIFRCYTVNEGFELAAEGYGVESFFLYEWKPLTAVEVEGAARLLAWSRTDLLAAAAGLDEAALNAPIPGERWPLGGILRHVGGAEWWYLDRLGLAFPQAELSKETFARLEQVRRRFEEILPDLAGRAQVVGLEGELWSPRKLIRRALWHERDHTGHILKLRNPPV